jgi:cytochrome P450
VDDLVMTTPLPPGPRGSPLWGSLFHMRRDPLRFFLETAQAYGDVVRYRMGRRLGFFFGHPDQIRDVLVTHQHSFMKGRGLQWAKHFLGEGLLTSEGEFHRRQRRLSQPAFHPQRLQTYGAVMSEYAVRARERWQAGAELDLHREMMALTMAVVGKTLFDADVEGEADEIGASLSAIIALFPRFSLPGAGIIHFLPLPSNFRFFRARTRLDATIYRMISERRGSEGDRGDLLSMLLLARDEEGDGGGMTDRQLRDEVMTLFLAGHETTANALAWTFYLLSQHPRAETRLHAELDAVLGGRPPSAEDIRELRYTEQVFAESMRLYPPAWGVGRRALRDQPIGGTLVPKGAFVVLSPYVTQRDPRFFPDPEAFDPLRFTPEAHAARPKFSYFPFGGGARQCIGERFAWMEGVLLIAAIAQRWRLRLVPGQRVEPQALITLRPRHGVRMRVERRAPAPGA